MPFVLNGPTGATSGECNCNEDNEPEVNEDIEVLTSPDYLISKEQKERDLRRQQAQNAIEKRRKKEQENVDVEPLKTTSYFKEDK